TARRTAGPPVSSFSQSCSRRFSWRFPPPCRLFCLSWPWMISLRQFFPVPALPIQSIMLSSQIMNDITPYIANADAFPILRHWDFFNHAGVSPLPRVAADALNRFAMEVAGDAYLGAHWHEDIERLRVTAAQLMNAHRDEIAFIKNTSEGLSIVANG